MVPVRASDRGQRREGAREQTSDVKGAKGQAGVKW
jgi:hypothetical protein